ncbi:MAG: SDR family oxidoreductase [Inquilinus sp.]|nr:SDR family oxidoreductase [Inquilinus sp.]
MEQRPGSARTDRPLAGRHALVTGAGRGIGAAIVAELAALGADITLSGRNAGALAATAALLPTRTHCAVADVTDQAAIDTAFAAAAQALGAVDILVNNAGIAASAPLRKVDDTHWLQVIDVNLTGVFRCMRAIVPGMAERGFGRVVNVASVAGLRGYPYIAAYCASKHGLIGLTRAVAMEMATSGVTVNAVCPGYTDTEMTAETLSNIRAKTGRSEAEAVAELAKFSPQRRLTRPDEVANAVGWLCLPASDGITGQSIVVAGGEVT